ncbi:MAG: Crp/Fnr family transcriptional regulator [bacterium]
MSKGSRIRLEPGEPLFVQGEVSEDIYFICSGRVKVTRVVGDEEWTLGEYVTNEVIGDLIPFYPLPRTCTVSAIEPTELYSMSNESLRHLLSSAPEVVVAFIKVMAQKLWETNLFIEQGFSVRHRDFWIRTLYVLSLLAELGEQENGEISLPDQPLRMNLATALGTKPLQTDRVVKKLLDSGLVRLNRSNNQDSMVVFVKEQVNYFIGYLQRQTDDKWEGNRLTEEQYEVANELVRFLHEHYGEQGLAVSSFREEALVDLLVDRPVLTQRSRDMKRRLLRENFTAFIDLGFIKSQGKRNRHLEIDVASIEMRLREDDLIRECDRCYKILIS